MDDLPWRFRCDRRWDELEGTGPRRWCDRCDEVVVDVGSVPPAERASLLTRACVRVTSAALLAVLITGPAHAEEPPAPTPQPATTDAPAVLGALDRTLIAGIITARFDELSAAYQARLVEKPTLAGKVVVKFTLRDGGVAMAETTSSTLGDPKLEEAVLAYVRSLTFEHQGAIAVSYPFVFAP